MEAPIEDSAEANVPVPVTVIPPKLVLTILNPKTHKFLCQKKTFDSLAQAIIALRELQNNMKSKPVDDNTIAENLKTKKVFQLNHQVRVYVKWDLDLKS